MTWDQAGMRTFRHFYIPFYEGANAAQTSIPVAITEVFNGTSNRRVMANLLGINRVRLIVGGGLAGPAGSELRLQYSLDSGGSFRYLDGVSGPGSSLVGIVTGILPSTWVNLEAAAKAPDVLLRMVTVNGNASTSPTIGHVIAEFIS